MDDAFEVGEHRNARLPLHAVDQALAAARNDDVERAVEARQHLAHNLAGGKGSARNGGFRQARLPQALDKAGVDRGGRVKAVRAAAQHHRVAALQAQRAGVGGDVRPALVDDADDAERGRDALDDEAVGAIVGREHPADRIGQFCDLLHPLRHRLDALFVKCESVDHRRRKPAPLGLAEVARIGGQDFRLSLAQYLCCGFQRVRFLLGGRVGDDPRRGAGGRADLAHRHSDVGIEAARDSSGAHRFACGKGRDGACSTARGERKSLTLSPRPGNSFRLPVESGGSASRPARAASRLSTVFRSRDAMTARNFAALSGYSAITLRNVVRKTSISETSVSATAVTNLTVSMISAVSSKKAGAATKLEKPVASEKSRTRPSTSTKPVRADLVLGEHFAPLLHRILSRGGENGAQRTVVDVLEKLAAAAPSG